MKGRVFMDRHSAGLDDMPRKEQGDMKAVLRVMDRIKRFSCFEASANQTIANTVTDAYRLGYIKDVGGAYPWAEVELTDAGRALMESP